MNSRLLNTIIYCGLIIKFFKKFYEQYCELLLETLSQCISFCRQALHVDIGLGWIDPLDPQEKVRPSYHVLIGELVEHLVYTGGAGLRH